MNIKWDKWKNTASLARIVAEISSDGHLQLQGWRGLVSFYSNDKRYKENILKRYKYLFGINGKVYPRVRKNTNYRIFFISKPLAIFLNSIGVPEGKKTNKPFLVPKWIFQGKPDIQSAYLRALYSCEGCIYATRQKNTRPRWRITIEMYKWEKYKENCVNFFKQIKIMLNNFGIRASPVRFGKKNLRSDGTYSVGTILDIEASQFEKFYKHIGFDDVNKLNRLLLALAEAKT